MKRLILSSVLFVAVLPSFSQNFHMIKDINDSRNSNAQNYHAYNSNGLQATQYIVVNNVAYFSADDGVHGNELWRSDGTAKGTYMVKDIAPGASGNVSNITSYNGLVFFSASDSANYYSLWRSDGTDTGTERLTTNVFPSEILAT